MLPSSSVSVYRTLPLFGSVDPETPVTERQIPITERVVPLCSKPVDDVTVPKRLVGLGSMGLLSSVMLVLLSLVPQVATVLKEKRMTHDKHASEKSASDINSVTKPKIILNDCLGDPHCPGADEASEMLSVWDLLRLSELEERLKRQREPQKPHRKRSSQRRFFVPLSDQAKSDKPPVFQKDRTYCEEW